MTERTAKRSAARFALRPVSLPPKEGVEDAAPCAWRRCSCGLPQSLCGGAGGVERHRPGRGPVAGGTAPALGMRGLGLRVERLALDENGRIVAAVALRGGGDRG